MKAAPMMTSIEDMLIPNANVTAWLVSIIKTPFCDLHDVSSRTVPAA